MVCRDAGRAPAHCQAESVKREPCKGKREKDKSGLEEKQPI